MRIRAISLWLFLLTAFLFLAQLFPPTGLLLAMVGAALWSSILLNCAFIAVVWDVRRGTLPVIFIILPVLYFVGYYAWFAVSYIHFAQYQTDVEETNALVHIPFDPQNQTLVVVESLNHMDFLDLPVIYKPYQKGYAPELISQKYEACRLVASNIAPNPHNHDENWLKNLQAGIIVTPVYSHKKLSRYKTEVPGRVFLCSPEDPIKPIVSITSEYQGIKTPLYDISENIITTVLPNGATYRLQGGHASLPAWVPLPVMDCGFGGWGCIARFLKQSSDVMTTPYNQVFAKALGMPISYAEDRAVVITAPSFLNEKYNTASKDKRDKLCAIVDKFLASPKAFPDNSDEHLPGRYQEHDLQVLLKECLKTRTDRIIRALYEVRIIPRTNGRDSEGRHDDQKRHRESVRMYTASVLAEYFARMPSSEFRNYVPAWIRLLGDGAAEWWIEYNENILARLGYYQEGHGLLLSRLSANNKRYNLQPVALGICRAGQALKQNAKGDLIRLLQEEPTNRYPDAQRQLYLAAYRLGLQDEIESEAAGNIRLKETAMFRPTMNVDSSSPPSICLLSNEANLRAPEDEP